MFKGIIDVKIGSFKNEYLATGQWELIKINLTVKLTFEQLS